MNYDKWIFGRETDNYCDDVKIVFKAFNLNQKFVILKVYQQIDSNIEIKNFMQQLTNDQYLWLVFSSRLVNLYLQF